MEGWQWDLAVRAWRRGNNEGAGMALGEYGAELDEEGIRSALEEKIGGPVEWLGWAEDIAILRGPDGSVYGVGDAHGWWCIRLDLDAATDDE